MGAAVSSSSAHPDPAAQSSRFGREMQEDRWPVRHPTLLATSLLSCGQPSRDMPAPRVPKDAPNGHATDLRCARASSALPSATQPFSGLATRIDRARAIASATAASASGIWTVSKVRRACGRRRGVKYRALLGPGTPSLPGKRSETAGGAQRQIERMHPRRHRRQPSRGLCSVRPARTEAGVTDANASSSETASCTAHRERRKGRVRPSPPGISQTFPLVTTAGTPANRHTSKPAG